ncbi:MAG: YtxH domain-containing protein [bacterium]
MNKKRLFLVIIVTIVGAVVGLLCSPKSGEKNRKKVVEKAKDIKDMITDTIGKEKT